MRSSSPWRWSRSVRVSRDAIIGSIVDPIKSRTEHVIPSALTQLLQSHCPAEGLVTLLTSRSDDIMRAAIVTLGLKGSLEHCSLLAHLLEHESREIVQLAEDSLWRIWLCSGTNEGNAKLAHAIGLIQAGSFQRAVGVLEGLITEEPEFAEAHNQLGIALCLLERLDEAAGAFGRVLRYNPHHFGAAVSLGHTYAQRGQLRLALHHYRHALTIHPRLENIMETVERLADVVGDGSVSP